MRFVITSCSATAAHVVAQTIGLVTFGAYNFLLDQGLLPPDLLAKAVREEFVPAQKTRR